MIIAHLCERLIMRYALMAVVGGVLAGLAVSTPVWAQAAHKKAVPKVTPAKPPAAAATGTIEQTSFNQGAVNTGSKGQVGASGKETTPSVDPGNGAVTNPVYKGPIIVPPTEGQPNDSAHTRPPH
jgi:hypothetical protein